MVAIDVFSGAGGMSLGAIMAGIEVRVAVESDVSAAETFKVNHPDTEVLCDDIRKVTFKNHNEDIFVLFGGPPCQGFSISNTKTRTVDNTNNSLFEEFIRMVNEVQPKWFVFENVEGIKSFSKGAVIKKLEEQFKIIGYEVRYNVLSASNYGVPQNRNRFFMVGNRIGVNFTFPDTHTKKISVHQAISDLPDLINGEVKETLPYKQARPSVYAQSLRNGSSSSTQNYVSKNEDYILERYRHIKQGQNWKAIPKELMANYKNSENCHSGIYRRLNAKEPSVVIANYRKNMLIHPFQDRGLSVREAARIQSFPDNFVFKGSLMHIQQQIGNAVPPLLAKAIFQQIINLTPQNEQRD